MNRTELLSRFLFRKADALRNRNLLTGIGLGVFGASLVLLASGVAFLILYLGSAVLSSGPRLSDTAARIVAGCLVAGQIAAYCVFKAAIDGVPITQLILSDDGRPAVIGLAGSGGRRHIVLIALFAGPRALVEGARLLWLGFGNQEIDYLGCAGILRLLLKRGGPVPIEEILTIAPHGEYSAGLVEQFLKFDGVVLVRSNPPAITLTESFRNEAAAASRTRKKRPSEANCFDESTGIE